MEHSSSTDKNIITFLGIIAIGLTTIIGSGIWKDPLLWANNAGIFAIVAVVVGWLLMITAGLAYAECVGMFPQSGGPYSYVGGAVNKELGTAVGLIYYIGYAFIGPILAFLTANFTLSIFNNNNGWYCLVLTIAYILILGSIAGIIPLRRLGDIAFYWILLKIILLLVVAVLMIAHANPQNYSISALTFKNFTTTTQKTIWALLGFDVMLVFAAEVTKHNTKKLEGRKLMPLSIPITLTIILILYVIVAFGASSIVGINDLSENTNAFDMMSTAIGLKVEYLYLFAAISAAGTTFAIYAVLAHQLKVMADDGSLPSVFKKEKKGIYYFNILFSLLLTIIVAVIMLTVNNTIGTLYSSHFSGDIDIITIFANTGLGFVLIAAMLPAGLIALYLRIKMPILERPFKTPIYYVIFPLAVLLSIYLIVLDILTLF